MRDQVRRDGARMLVERTLATSSGNREGQVSGRRVTVNAGESPLTWLRTRGHIDMRQFAAGERLRADWERAGLAPRVTMNWDGGGGVGGRRSGMDPAEATLAQIAAKRRFDDAIKALGPGLTDIAWRVICAGDGLGAAEKMLGWPARAGKLVLGMALSRLADFYRL